MENKVFYLDSKLLFVGPTVGRTVGRTDGRADGRRTVGRTDGRRGVRLGKLPESDPNSKIRGLVCTSAAQSNARP